MRKLLILILTLSTLVATAQQEPRVDPTHQHLGKVHLGQSQPEAETFLGRPSKKEAEVFEAATGEYLQRWRYPKLGLVVEMSSASSGGPLSVYRLEARTPNDWAAFGGVKVGSSIAEVEKALKKAEAGGGTEVYRDPKAGSFGILWSHTYVSLSLVVRDGKVHEIYLGPGPE